MEQIRIRRLLERMQTSRTYANLVGTNGFILEKILQAFLSREQLGRCLGPAKNEGNEMAQWVLKDNGKVLPQRTLRQLSTAKLSLTNESEAERRMLFTTSVLGILGDSISLPAGPPPNPMDKYWELEPYEDDVESPLAFLEADIVDAAGKPFMAYSLTDTLINAEVLLPREDSQAIAKVVRLS